MTGDTTHDEQRRENWDGERPNVSVIVPVYNDPAGIRDTLDALTEQTYPNSAHEILVVDNDSTDETPAIVQAYADEHEQVTFLIESDRQSSYAARNMGLEHATGDIFAFIDADMTVEEDWLADAVRAFERRDAEYMGCNVEMIPAADGDSLAQQYKLQTGFPIDYFIEELGFAPTCCLLVRRSVVDDVGAFDPRLVSSGDREFGHRVRDSGRELQFAPEVTMYHPTRSTIDSILKKSRRIGRGVYQLRLFHGDRYDDGFPVALNPWPYLPPRLEQIRGIDGWESLSRREKVGFYLLSYGRGVWNGFGRLEETFRRHVPSNS